MTQFDELLKKRRSIRKFKSKSVPYELIRSVINDCTMAPSSGNEQPWEFIIVSDRSLLDEISRDCKKELLKRLSDNPEDYVKKYKGLLSREDYNIFYNAPVLVYIIGPAELKNTEINCTLAAGYFMFSAAAKGLGTCWISFARYIGDEEIKKRLGISPGHLVAAPIIVGYPETIPVMAERKAVNIINTFGYSNY